MCDGLEGGGKSNAESEAIFKHFGNKFGHGDWDGGAGGTRTGLAARLRAAADRATAR